MDTRIERVIGAQIAHVSMLRALILTHHDPAALMVVYDLQQQAMQALYEASAHTDATLDALRTQDKEFRVVAAKAIPSPPRPARPQAGP